VNKEYREKLMQREQDTLEACETADQDLLKKYHLVLEENSQLHELSSSLQAKLESQQRIITDSKLFEEKSRVLYEAYRLLNENLVKLLES
jgi:hypothetical protein